MNKPIELPSGTTMNQIHKLHYPTAMQMAKKFVSKWEIRPQLMLVYHDEQGGIWATDSHRLLHIADVHGFGNKFEGGVLVNPKTFEMAEQFGTDRNKVTLHIESEAPRLLFKDNGTKIDMNLPIQKNNYAPAYSPCGVIAYNAAYMADALETMIKLKVEQVNIQFTGQNGAFVLRSEDEKVTVMILPVRVY